MTKKALPCWLFSLIVVHHEDSFILIQESKHQNSWYLPAGRVEFPESFQQTAIREVREEAGIDIVLEHLVEIDYAPFPKGEYRIRAILLARPEDPSIPLKNNPDKHSLKARWVGLNELDEFTFRDPEVGEILKNVSSGQSYPLEVLRNF